MLKWIQSFNKHEEKFPPPPEGSKRTRCYRLNLDAPIMLSAENLKVLDVTGEGPISYEPPLHLLSSKQKQQLQRQKKHDIFRRNSIARSSSIDSINSTSSILTSGSVDSIDDHKRPQDAARIFRNLEVDLDGKIVSTQVRATKSDDKGNSLHKNDRRATKSAKKKKKKTINLKKLTSGGRKKNSHQQGKQLREDSKIDKMSTQPFMKEEGEDIEEIHTAHDPSVVHYPSDMDKENRKQPIASTQQMLIENARNEVDKADNNHNIDNEKVKESKPHSNMLSLVVIGEYNDFKNLVRDGVKNLHDAEGLSDEALLAINRPRITFLTAYHQEQLKQQLEQQQQQQRQFSSTNSSSIPSIAMSSSYSSTSGNDSGNVLGSGGEDGINSGQGIEVGYGSYHDLKILENANGILEASLSSSLAYSSWTSSSHHLSGSSRSMRMSNSSSITRNHHVPKLKSHPRDRSLARLQI